MLDAICLDAIAIARQLLVGNACGAAQFEQRRPANRDEHLLDLQQRSARACVWNGGRDPLE